MITVALDIDNKFILRGKKAIVVTQSWSLPSSKSTLDSVVAGLRRSEDLVDHVNDTGGGRDIDVESGGSFGWFIDGFVEDDLACI